MNFITRLKARYGKWAVIVPVCVVLAVAAPVLYVNYAFPKTRCTAFKHLKGPEERTDCYECHLKVTPKVAQNWYDSKHGVILVKCFVCHGQPDDKGSIPFAVKPDVNQVCRRCHDPAIARMQQKFGVDLDDCYSCHPFHQNSLHHDAYRKSESKQKIE